MMAYNIDRIIATSSGNICINKDSSKVKNQKLSENATPYSHIIINKDGIIYSQNEYLSPTPYYKWLLF
tara:strand:- start:747 stop:950 length:204 start_codon:yes stop_codon:yes gene_type:complete